MAKKAKENLAKKGKELSENLMENVSGGVVEQLGKDLFSFDGRDGNIHYTSTLKDAIVLDKDSTKEHYDKFNPSKRCVEGITEFVAHGGNFDGTVVKYR